MSDPEGSSNKQTSLCVWCLFIWGDRMGYIALYRKYRPLTFDNILGQESVTKILKNQVKTGKISHAYLFSGTRGTGKTSAAKVFARAINCLNPKDGEPCNECEVCKGILEGNTSDVVEMDAASNNSVENIRQIRQEVVYATVDVKYRVYIIDEVHMLTTSAFNALLKTLEEPPENVVFILATTEQHKIPVTILSRCLRFEFNRLSTENIVERLKYVLENEKIAYEDEALEYVAKLADGAMRDALSILDRCISEMSEKLTYNDIQKVVGAIDKQIVKNIVEAILAYDVIKANENIDIVIKKGKDLRQLVYELNEEFLSLLINSKGDSKKITNIIDRLSKLDSDLKQSARPSIILKSSIIELCNNVTSQVTSIDNSDNSSNADLLNTINILSNKVASLESEIASLKSNLNDKSNISIARAVNKNRAPKKEQKEENNKKDEEKELVMTEFTELEEFNKSVAEHGKLKLFSALAGSTIYLTDDYVLVITNNSFAYNILKMDDSIETISDIMLNNYSIDKDIRIELKEADEGEENTSSIEKVFKQNNINYTDLD